MARWARAFDAPERRFPDPPNIQQFARDTARAENRHDVPPRFAFRYCRYCTLRDAGGGAAAIHHRVRRRVDEERARRRECGIPEGERYEDHSELWSELRTSAQDRARPARRYFRLGRSR